MTLNKQELELAPIQHHREEEHNVQMETQKPKRAVVSFCEEIYTENIYGGFKQTIAFF
jgi:hypothetical protein